MSSTHKSAPPPASKSRESEPGSPVNARFTGGATPVSGLTPPVRTETNLDQQVAMLTTALGRRLALADAAAEDPRAVFQGRLEIEKAVELAKATAELARAKARLLGESIRYQVLRVDGKEAARLARNDYWPHGLTEEEAATLTDDELLARYALPPRPRGKLAPGNEPFEIEPPRDPDKPVMTDEEFNAVDGTQRFMARLAAEAAARGDPACKSRIETTGDSASARFTGGAAPATATAG